MQQKLTVDILAREAKAFCEGESNVEGIIPIMSKSTR